MSSCTECHQDGHGSFDCPRITGARLYTPEQIKAIRQQTRTAVVEEVLRDGPKDIKGSRAAYKAGKINWNQLQNDETYNQANRDWRSILLKAKGGEK